MNQVVKVEYTSDDTGITIQRIYANHPDTMDAIPSGVQAGGHYTLDGLKKAFSDAEWDIIPPFENDPEYGKEIGFGRGGDDERRASSDGAEG